MILFLGITYSSFDYIYGLFVIFLIGLPFLNSSAFLFSIFGPYDPNTKELE
jgi:hypothetical protein